MEGGLRFAIGGFALLGCVLLPDSFKTKLGLHRHLASPHVDGLLACPRKGRAFRLAVIADCRHILSLK